MSRFAAIGIAALCLLACGSAEEPSPESSPQPPPAPHQDADLGWPDVPTGMSADVRRCVEEYRVLAEEGLPDHDTGMTFELWQVGPYNGWVVEYNEVRERCDEVLGEAEPESVEAQVLTGAQSSLHERVSVQASVYQAEAQMYLMARYWTLGASCTYAHCANGPNEAWASFCAERGQSLPPCSTPQAEPEVESTTPSTEPTPSEAAPAQP